MRNDGIPRTLSAAEKRGFKPSKTLYEKMTPEDKARLISFDVAGRKRGSISHLLPPKDGKVGAGPTPGSLQICYHAPDGSPICVPAIRDANGKVVPAGDG